MKNVTMSIKDFVREHEDLKKVLKKGDKSELKKEFVKQSKELKGIQGLINKKIKK